MDGKTTVAANLAISVAKEGRSVTLVDADLHNPSLHQVFDLKNRRGLAEVVLQDAAVEEALTRVATQSPKATRRMIEEWQKPHRPVYWDA